MLTPSSKGKICALVLLAVYIIAGVTILSTVTNQQRGTKTRKHVFNSRSRGFDFSPSIRESSRRPKMQWCQPLRFLDDDSRPLIALASFPGSGNTWLRYLIQQATGRINTGSVYKDFGLLKNGFPGEHVFDSSVVVVKTHERGSAPHRSYDKAVVLVRDPKQAIQAEFNRQGGGHIGFASPDKYTIKKGKYWEKFVFEQIVKWKETNLYWIFNFTQPTMIVFYDELITDLEGNLRRLLKFLEVNVTESQIKCALERREGIYRRKKRMINLDPFTSAMNEKIEATKKEVYTLISDYLDNKKPKEVR